MWKYIFLTINITCNNVLLIIFLIYIEWQQYVSYFRTFGISVYISKFYGLSIYVISVLYLWYNIFNVKLKVDLELTFLLTLFQNHAWENQMVRPCPLEDQSSIAAPLRQFWLFWKRLIRQPLVKLVQFFRLFCTIRLIHACAFNNSDYIQLLTTEK